MPSAPSITSEKTGEGIRLALAGAWTVEAGRFVEHEADELIGLAEGAQRATIDLGGVEQLDTAGAWLLDRTRAQLSDAGVDVAYSRAKPEYKILLEEAHFRVFDVPPRHHHPTLRVILSDIGESVCGAGEDLLAGVSFLGHLVSALMRVVVNPRRLRLTPLIFHLEAFGLDRKSVV